MRATHAKWPSQSRVRGQQQHGLYAKPINISDDEEVGQVFDQSEFQNMSIDIGGGDDDSVEAALGLSL